MKSVCILRLSAIGDVCHALAVVRALQSVWPEARFTWIIGRIEAKLLGHLPDIEFIVFNKRDGLSGYTALRRQLAARRFDALLHMQYSLRASIAAALVRAPLKLGYDRARARELQGWFCNARIAARSRQHVLDTQMGFAEYFGVPGGAPRWDIPLAAEAAEHAAALMPDEQPTLLISPCSSQAMRNWHAEGYAQVARHAANVHGMRVLVTGGPSDEERRVGAYIEQHSGGAARSLVGTDTLPQMLATLARATVLISPDSGPAHMATAMGTPVIGLYAATNPERSGAYLSRAWWINRYPDATRLVYGKPPEQLAWGAKCERPGVMDLITAEEVKQQLDRFMARRRGSL